MNTETGPDPIVADVSSKAANETSEALTLWEVFAALQDAADESATTRDEADALVCATFIAFRGTAPVCREAA